MSRRNRRDQDEMVVVMSLKALEMPHTSPHFFPELCVRSAEL
jgi:hypothetical protein